VVPAIARQGELRLFAEIRAADLFNRTMAKHSELTMLPCGGYDFSVYPTIVDVGGGHGSLLASILAATPHSQGVLYDIPASCRRAKDLVERDVADRVRIEAGSFFDSVPAVRRI